MAKPKRFTSIYDMIYIKQIYSLNYHTHTYKAASALCSVITLCGTYSNK